MAVDEYGREPGVDYSQQTWTIAGHPSTQDPVEAQEIIAAEEASTP